ncbi:tyrosine-protein phosphatase [Polaribacter sp. KT 15]|uniref:tyrosine-protein phosphatase n=1 Tax=Polaribacter sp. KT 15 TaxID=1896175 RepID=UPI00090B3125|nr:CpsB/CapC family capsule biosynthesis tyrosine phosphatase [Polaribacter sp. KT 15]SHN01110.1 Tyrosine-protein phosphatase YwqE [Polaribacter sp. KT 15]
MFFFKKKEIPLTDFFTNNFVDIHSHLLPGIDDGAKNIDNSVELILKMYSYGIKNFITTPHVLGDVYPNSSETIKSKLKEVRTALKNKGYSDIKINAAAEYMMDEQFIDRLKANDILTLKGNYILVEMSYFNAPMNLYDVLFDIQLKGYKPVLAHPERYNFFHNDLQNYHKLKKAGCLFQLNLLSLTEQYGKNVQKISNELLKQNLYDFVGSDTHHKKHLQLLKKIGTQKNLKKIKHLLDNNSKVFN